MPKADVIGIIILEIYVDEVSNSHLSNFTKVRVELNIGGDKLCLHLQKRALVCLLFVDGYRLNQAIVALKCVDRTQSEYTENRDEKSPYE